jgi:homocitrate synthase NifV
MGRIYIDDTTLRDGEQTPGLFITKRDKINIAKNLDKLGVDEIEAGFPASGKMAKESFAALCELNLKARLLAWNRAKIEDIKSSLEAGASNVEISLPVSDIQIKNKLNKDKKWILDELKRVLDFCKDKRLYVSVGGEDSSRADMSFLLQFVMVAEKCGADRFRFCDTVGVLDPFTAFDKVKLLKENTTLPIEIHFHNDLGMATANSLAAVKAGAEYVNTTFMGIGERAGNASLEEIVILLNMSVAYETGCHIPLISNISQDIAKILKLKIPFNKPIIGRNVFSHESGMHVDGVLKAPENYEPFPPDAIGRKRSITFGYSSGRAALVYLLKKWGINIEKEVLNTNLLEFARKCATIKKYL